MRVVIADDSTIARAILEQGLRARGHDVVGAAVNGKEAVDLCRIHRPDVALLDVSMPIMPGNVAAGIIVEQKLATHVVIASSASMDAVFAPLLAIGCHVLAKPYDKYQIGAQLETLAHA